MNMKFSNIKTNVFESFIKIQLGLLLLLIRAIILYVSLLDYKIELLDDSTNETWKQRMEIGTTKPGLFSSNCIKKLVSGKKRRFRNDKFDLDLALNYIVI